MRKRVEKKNSEFRIQKSEVRSQKTEDRRRVERPTFNPPAADRIKEIEYRKRMTNNEKSIKNPCLTTGAGKKNPPM